MSVLVTRDTPLAAAEWHVLMVRCSLFALPWLFHVDAHVVSSRLVEMLRAQTMLEVENNHVEG